MRRSNEEFKQEVLCRCRRYRRSRATKMTAVVGTLCLMLAILITVPQLPAAGGSSKADSAASLEYGMNETWAANLQSPPAEQEKWDICPHVMVDGILYYDTGKVSQSGSGPVEGQITSSVEGWELAQEDDQSNFGTGYFYRSGPEEGTLEVKLNDKWYIFAAE